MIIVEQSKSDEFNPISASNIDEVYRWVRNMFYYDPSLIWVKSGRGFDEMEYDIREFPTLHVLRRRFDKFKRVIISSSERTITISEGVLPQPSLF